MPAKRAQANPAALFGAGQMWPLSRQRALLALAIGGPEIPVSPQAAQEEAELPV